MNEEQKPAWNPNDYLEADEAETTFADVAPLIGEATKRNPNEFDITHLNRGQRRRLIRQLGLKLNVDSKVTDHKEELKRRKLRRKKIK